MMNNSTLTQAKSDKGNVKMIRIQDTAIRM